MRARYLLPVIFPLIAFSQKVDFEKIELGKRNDKYRVWIYFTDKKGSQQITLSPKTIKRRIKNSVRTINNRYDIPVSEKYKSLIKHYTHVHTPYKNSVKCGFSVPDV